MRISNAHAIVTGGSQGIGLATARILASRSSADWLAALEAADIPVMPLHDLAGVLEDPHLRAVGFFGSDEHPTEGTVRTMRAPVRFNGCEPARTMPAPRLGEHTTEVLLEAGYEESELAALSEEGITR